MIDVSIEPTRPAASKKKKKNNERNEWNAGDISLSRPSTTTTEQQGRKKKGEAIELLACEASDHRSQGFDSQFDRRVTS